MFYLIIAVLCSVSVSVLLKILRQYKIDIRQTIAIGYPVACLLTWFLLKPNISRLPTSIEAWSIILSLGILLPSVFIILGKSIERNGIIATDAAQRLSLIIPIISAFILFGESLSLQRIIGIGLGFGALIALLYRSPKITVNVQNTQQLFNNQNLIWLLSVWLGYGIIDILFKQVAKQGTAFSITLFIGFLIAGCLLFIYLWLLQRIHWEKKALSAGLLLGILNIGNIYAYIKAHQTLAHSPSIVFTGMNVGVIAVAAVTGVILFKEKLNNINILGLLLAISCVITLIFA